jgi:hypothetical protein
VARRRPGVEPLKREHRRLLDEVAAMAAMAATLPEPIGMPVITDLFCARVTG